MYHRLTGFDLNVRAIYPDDLFYRGIDKSLTREWVRIDELLRTQRFAPGQLNPQQSQ